MSLTCRINANGYLPDGTPIVRSHTVTGTLFRDGEPYPNAYIEIIEPDIDDIGTGYSDARGNFDIKVGEDTMHHVWVDSQDIQLVKIITQ
jgi:hypothetical protein